MDTGVVVTFAGITVAGLAGILGVWMERNRNAPQGWAYVFTALLVLATGLKVAHSIAQKAENALTEEAMARVLERLVALSESGTNPALDQLVGAELAVQSRSNPQVIERLEGRVKAKGGDPTALHRRAVAARRAAAGLPVTRVKGAKAAAAAAKTVEDVVVPLVDGTPLEIPAVLPEKAEKAGKQAKGGKNR